MERTEDAHKFRNAIYEQFARIGKAVSSPKRLELLDMLSQGPRTVESLAQAIDQSVANTSQHLQILRTSRMVEADKNGLYVHYKLADEAVGDFFRSLRRLAEKRLAEVNMVTREFLNEHGLIEEIDRDKLVERVKNGDVVVIDLRSTKEYEDGHIPGAESVPARDLEKHLEEIPKDQDVVAYCRGPYCVLGVQAVEFLRKNGINAHRLEHGVPEWKALGNDIESVSNGRGDR